MRIAEQGMIRTWAVRALALLASICAAPLLSHSQETPATSEGAQPIEFPPVWVGSPPISVDNLHGKAVFLYFYEERCPKCKGKWPGILETARKFQDQPIVFVAVNSGTPRPQVEQYAREVGLDWPIIVDLDRSFEAKCGVGEVSLQNIHQVAYLNAEGQVKRGNWSDMEGTVTRALEGAKWTVAPSEVPEELRPAWRNVEFGEFAAAAGILAKAKSARKAEVKAAAQKLSDAVDQQLQAAMQTAKSEKSPYRAYEQYGVIARRFAGYPAVNDATNARRELVKQADYKKELAAIKQLDRQRQLAASTKPAVRQKALDTLKKIAADAPDSEAGRRAQQLLDGK